MIGVNGKLSILVLTFGCVSAFAQTANVPAAGSPGCGDSTIKFDVKTSGKQASPKPEVGDALVYIIQDDSDYFTFPKPTTRAGLDGKWLGATRGNSFFSFNVTPGVHHLCASWQPSVTTAINRVSSGQASGAKSFTVQAGGVYYFVVKDTCIDTDFAKTLRMDLRQVDGDEGQLLVNSRAVASVKQK